MARGLLGTITLRFAAIVVLTSAAVEQPMAKTRKLAVILAADMVGFSRISADEDRTRRAASGVARRPRADATEEYRRASSSLFAATRHP